MAPRGSRSAAPPAPRSWRNTAPRPARGINSAQGRAACPETAPNTPAHCYRNCSDKKAFPRLGRVRTAGERRRRRGAVSDRGSAPRSRHPVRSHRPPGPGAAGAPPSCPAPAEPPAGPAPAVAGRLHLPGSAWSRRPGASRPPPRAHGGACARASGPGSGPPPAAWPGAPRALSAAGPGRAGCCPARAVAKVAEAAALPQMHGVVLGTALYKPDL